MFGTVRSPAEATLSPTGDNVALEERPTDLVPLSALTVEGFGWGGFVASPLDAIAALAAQLDGEVELDDLGRRCVTREVARRLFAERAAAEAKRQEMQERLDAEYLERAAANPVWPGIPADQIPDGVAPALAMLTAAKDAHPKRQSVLEHALQDRDGAIEYFPIEQP
jgi:hypothetical protein